MTTPLTFIVYAHWGRLVGFDTARLRLLSPLLATAACVLLWLVLAPGARNRLHAAIALFVIALNPYFLGLGIFVFTDMLAIVMMAIVLLGYVKKSAVLVAVGIAGSVLTRQYFAFLVPALIASSLLDRRLGRTRRFSLLSAALIGLSALTPLYYLWGNHLSPTNSLRAVYTNEGIAYNFHALSLYLSAPAAYSLPTLVLAIISNRLRSVSIAAGIATAGFVLVFPVEASAVQITEGSLTVGFLHRLISATLPHVATRIVFGLMAAFVVTVCASRLLASVKSGISGATLFCWLSVTAFLGLMPFSYMAWEKYAVPMFILIAIALVSDNAPEPSSSPTSKKHILGRHS